MVVVLDPFRTITNVGWGGEFLLILFYSNSSSAEFTLTGSLSGNAPFDSPYDAALWVANPVNVGKLLEVDPLGGHAYVTISQNWDPNVAGRYRHSTVTGPFVDPGRADYLFPPKQVFDEEDLRNPPPEWPRWEENDLDTLEDVIPGRLHDITQQGYHYAGYLANLAPFEVVSGTAGNPTLQFAQFGTSPTGLFYVVNLSQLPPPDPEFDQYVGYKFRLDANYHGPSAAGRTGRIFAGLYKFAIPPEPQTEPPRGEFSEIQELIPSMGNFMQFMVNFNRRRPEGQRISIERVDP